LGSNQKELHTPTSILKNPKEDGGDMKKKLELERVFCENKVW